MLVVVVTVERVNLSCAAYFITSLSLLLILLVLALHVQYSKCKCAVFGRLLSS